MSGNIGIKSWGHVGIRVHELERSRRFYERLGFEFIVGPIGPEPVAIMKHPSGIEINLVLNAPEAVESNVLMDIPQKHPGYTHMALRVDNLAKAKATLEEAGVVITEEVEFPTGVKAIFFRDPDRNVIELDQAAPS